MTSKQSSSIDRANLGADKPALDQPIIDLPDMPGAGVETLSFHVAASHFGARLRAAREARGLDLSHCANALKLPLRVLRQLESDDYSGIDYQVYLTGYISKYGRYLGVDEIAIQAERARLKPDEPALVATGGISHSRYLLEHYARAATYVVLTAAIVVPTIWLGVRGTLDRDVSHLAPLDAAPVAQQEQVLPAATSSSGTAVSTAVQTPPAAPVHADEQPLLASMTPFLGGDSTQPAKPTVPDATTTGAGAHSLTLNLPNASWVEVTTPAGSRLEYGLLPAGSAKTYRSDQPLEVRLGNASGAEITLDGQPLALDGYRRANVAHFRIEVRDGKATPAAF
ncbi:helix-turn-helix domain-containing protein [Dyella tabacisoli]|uniref:Helix-turn-helix domain-containing protein n=1 Tax=Dyella tabacisoli TaxID=2282381 RepID=A0A369UMG7_9GAMM|nr:helix-turn-helix domain-containing protein [Dyella tabacisoli]RDD81275.1 helix-turn-helix domain-containing protein [Dyella tabacisoli]